MNTHTPLDAHAGANLLQLHTWAQSWIARAASGASGMGHPYGPVHDRYQQAIRGEVDWHAVAGELGAIGKADEHAVRCMVHGQSATIGGAA